jgi:TPR repeat protein
MSDIQFNLNNINFSNTDNSEFFQIIKNSDKMNIKEIEPTTKNINEYIFEEDLSIVIDELVNLIFNKLNEGKDELIIKQYVLNYITNNHKIILQEICNWLLNNQNNSNSIYLFGYFNYHGIGIDNNKRKAIEIYHKAAKLENYVAQIDLANIYIHGKGGVEEDHDLAFKLSKKLAEKGIPNAINRLGFCYNNGIGTCINKQKAFETYKKAADLGNSTGISNLGWCYENGAGTDVNEQKAFEIYQKAADLGNSFGINNLGWCYDSGIGTAINKQKAFELYQKAANLGNYLGQYNVALTYEYGDLVKEDINQAIYWYKKSAEQGYKHAQKKLAELTEE